MKELIRSELLEATKVLNAFLEDEKQLEKIEQAAILLAESIRSGGKIISCGNGGSHCDAMHFAEELSGRYRDNRRALPAIAISDPSHISCVSNDYGYDQVFSRFIEGLGKPEDALLGISTSGNSITEGIGNSRVTANMAGAPADDAIQVNDHEALQAVYQLLYKDGLFMGGSVGINVGAAVKLAQQMGPGHTIVTILCDSGARYQSRLFSQDWLKSKDLWSDSLLPSNF